MDFFTAAPLENEQSKCQVFTSLIQQSLVKKLGLWNCMLPCQQQVRYGNGETEPMVGVVTLPVQVHGTDMPMRTYVLHNKGPA